MKRFITGSFLCIALAAALPAFAADPPHPSGHPGGHPGMAGPGFGPGIQSAPDGTLPAGRVVVSVRKDGETPLPGATVILHKTLQNIAEGDTKHDLSARTGPTGEVTFDGVETSVRSVAKVSVRALGADYEVPEFRPPPSSGYRIVVPVFDSTPSPTEAMVGLRGFIFIQLREGQFVFDVLFRVFALGDKTWVPSGLRLDLPSGLSGFEAVEGGVVQDGAHGARLAGSFPPGQKDVRLNFRMPAGLAESEAFQFSLPPNVAEMRVITEYAPGMSLKVAGFEPVQEARGPDGTRVLVTRRLAVPGEQSLPNLTVELNGLPTIGPERWYAVGAAVALALTGLWFSRRTRQGAGAGEVREARRLLLLDLRSLEAARAGGEIGPQTYERARRELVLALARLETEPAAAS